MPILVDSRESPKSASVGKGAHPIEHPDVNGPRDTMDKPVACKPAPGIKTTIGFENKQASQVTMEEPAKDIGNPNKESQDTEVTIHTI